MTRGEFGYRSFGILRSMATLRRYIRLATDRVGL